MSNAPDYVYGIPADERPDEGAVPADDILDTADDVAPSRPLTDLEALAADLAKDVDLAPSVTLAVPGRDGWAVEYRTDVKAHELDQWRRRSRDRKATEGFDPLKFSTMVLVNTCVGFVFHGEDVEVEDRATRRMIRATFAAPGFLDLLGVRDTVGAVRRLFGPFDASIINTATAVVEAAGYGDMAAALDPQ